MIEFCGRLCGWRAGTGPGDPPWADWGNAAVNESLNPMLPGCHPFLPTRIRPGCHLPPLFLRTLVIPVKL